LCFDAVEFSALRVALVCKGELWVAGVDLPKSSLDWRRLHVERLLLLVETMAEDLGLRNYECNDMENIFYVWES